MKRKALFIGVNDYRDPEIRNLSCSVRDAISMHDIFEELGYQTSLLENPGKGDVFHAIRKITSDMAAGDQFLFYFAGHGFTDSGQHLLFCADDIHEHLRFHRAGIPFGLLEMETRKGGYGRAFLLDACQSDFLTGTRGEDATTRDLVAIGDMVPKSEDVTGAFYVLRSCSKYEHALEIESRKHGLFTLAMIDILRQSKKSGMELLFSDSLRETVRAKMYCIAQAEGITARQTPESDGRGAVQVLLSGTNASILPSEPALPSSAVAAYVICPICGKKNHPENTFKCGKCGRDNLCLRHQDEKTFRCSDCVAKKEKEESDRKTIEQEARATKDGRKSELEQQDSEIRVNTRRAIEESNNGNIGKAYEFAQKADLNNDMVQYIIGYALVNGIGCEKDVQGGIDWMLKAAMQGLATSQYSLGILYLEGKDLHQDDIEAVKWFKKAADNGYAPAQASLSYCYASARGVSKSESAAIMWCRKAAEKGFVPAQYNMGVMYYNGYKAIAKDEAIKWLRMATGKGNNDATKLLSLIEEDGNDAQSLYEKAEDCYHGQNGVKEDRAKAFELYQKTAEQGHAEAQYSLGYMYAYGEGVAKNNDKALFWYGKAAAQGHQKAARFLSGLKERIVKEQEEERARAYWGKKEEERRLNGAQARQEITQRERDAQFRVEKEWQDTEEKMSQAYKFYEDGNYSAAALLWRICAVRGVAAAQHNLGALYATGKGVEQDYAQAIEWLQKGAAQGDEDSQKLLDTIKLRLHQGRQRLQDEKERLQSEKERLLNEKRRLEQQNASELEERRRLLQEQGRLLNSLGVRFYNGTHGQRQDYAKAVEHFKKAAEIGNASAQFNLGVCYASGAGVAKNVREAIRWYRKAAENGHDKAKEELRELGEM